MNAEALNSPAQQLNVQKLMREVQDSLKTVQQGLKSLKLQEQQGATQTQVISFTNF